MSAGRLNWWSIVPAIALCSAFSIGNLWLSAQTAELVAVHDDPLVRMPGTQPSQGVNVEGPGRCMNCHADYNHAVEPGYNWHGSMMAQAGRDPIF